jgi:transcriptional regulator
VRDDADWVRKQVTELTAQQEAARATPWAVADAPRDYTDTMIKALVGIEIPLTQITGKWKVSQNQPAVNQVSVVAGLQQQGSADALAMAALVREFGVKSGA